MPTLTPLLSLAAALTAGFAGSAHCLVMCGGMAGALGMRARASLEGTTSLLFRTLLQQLGRISGYAMAGALVGGLTQGASSFMQLAALESPLRIAAGLVTALVAVRMLGGRNWLVGVERVGAHLWRWLQPLAQRAVSGGRWYHAMVIGLAWGWLPCGMVYSALLLAATSGSSLSGAAVMLSFGLGTVPALLMSGLMAAQMPRIAGRPAVRMASGAVLLLLALWMLLPATWLPAHHTHHTTAAMR